MYIKDDLLDMSKSRPEWQQDLLRRLCQQRELTDVDLEQVCELAKCENGIHIDEPSCTLECFEEKHLGAPPEITEKIVLKKISGLENVNKLAADQEIVFAPVGLTVVYGDNASGKSGYCRVLKRACRARGRENVEILGDVYKEQGDQQAQAVISFIGSDGNENNHVWKDGDEPHEELSRVTVFDVTAAPLYADSEGKLEFLPFGLDLPERLITELGEVEKKFKYEKEVVENKLELMSWPEVNATGKVARMLKQIDEAGALEDLPSERKIKALAKWTTRLEERLKELEIKLAGDPAALAQKCSDANKVVNQLSQEIKMIEDAIGKEGLEKLENVAQQAVVARQAADELAKETFDDQPLDGVGSDPWREMFRFAREYSSLAYPGEAFPITGEGKRCVLCQQELSPEANERLKRFDRYVNEEAAKSARKKERARDQAKKELAELKTSDGSTAKKLLEPVAELDKRYDGLPEVVEAYLEAGKKLREQAVDALEDLKKFKDLKPLADVPTQMLQEAARRLDALSKDYSEAQDEDKRRALQDKLTEFKDRKNLTENLEQVLKYRDGCELWIRLEKCRASCHTRGISLANSRMREKYISKGLKKSIDREIQALNIGHLPFKLSEHSAYGQSKWGVWLETKKDVYNSQVLSDGEFKTLALVAFLTEVKHIPGKYPIILDDPVSSLDHGRAGRVAKRMVLEAHKGRQVIIFTHDLVFYHELSRYADQMRVGIAGHWVRSSTQEGTGVVQSNDSPWQAKKVKQRLHHLRILLAKIKRIENHDSDEYQGMVVLFYMQLRETWERFVEEKLLNDVVMRFRPGIETQRLKSVKVTKEDYKLVSEGMTNASRYTGHDTARAMQHSWPKPDELEEDLNLIIEYENALKERVGKAKNTGSKPD